MENIIKTTPFFFRLSKFQIFYHSWLNSWLTHGWWFHTLLFFYIMNKLFYVFNCIWVIRIIWICIVINNKQKPKETVFYLKESVEALCQHSYSGSHSTNISVLQSKVFNIYKCYIPSTDFFNLLFSKAWSLSKAGWPMTSFGSNNTQTSSFIYTYDVLEMIFYHQIFNSWIFHELEDVWNIDIQIQLV